MRSCTSSEAKARIDELTRHNTQNWITATLADVTFVDETCEAHGLPVNMNDGKAEFPIEMTGVGARKQFKRLWREDKKAHCISTKTGKSARVVSRYKHVAETKANRALTAYHQLVHSVFRNSRISLHLREQLANSLPCVFRA